MIYVVATICSQPGRRDEVLRQFARIVPLVRAETGCIAYTPAIDLETNINTQVDPSDDVITVVEQWESVEALEMHLIAPHMIEHRASVKSLVKSVALRVLEPA
jgi:quinol monooxygenase YgiN